MNQLLCIIVFLAYKVDYQSETLIIDLGLLAESDAWRIARLIFCCAGLVPFGILTISAIFFFAQCRKFFSSSLSPFLKIGRAFRIVMVIYIILGKGIVIRAETSGFNGSTESSIKYLGIMDLDSGMFKRGQCYHFFNLQSLPDSKLWAWFEPKIRKICCHIFSAQSLEILKVVILLLPLILKKIIWARYTFKIWTSKFEHQIP